MAIKNFSEAIQSVDDEVCREAAIEALSCTDISNVDRALLPIQQARMFCNQGITIDDFRGKYKKE